MSSETKDVLTLREVDDPKQRWTNREQHQELAGWHAHFLEALGYADRQAVDLAVEGGESVAPVLARVNRYNKPWLAICETM